MSKGAAPLRMRKDVVAEETPKVVRREAVYEGRLVTLEIQDVESADGRRVRREVCRHAGSVAVLALRRGADGRREVLLERNYRYPFERRIVEIPAGTLDRPGESRIDCARRELAEETGLRATELRELFTLLTAPGLLDERMTVFAAEDVSPGEAAPDAGELIDCFWVPWDEALGMIRSGDIVDGKTIAALLHYEVYVGPGRGG